ncbi:MAG: Fe-S cluster assembly protein SufD [Staphylococcus sp.]|nr:Fe-S cluster assembly protein SufD [Staphylococcus sp.]
MSNALTQYIDIFEQNRETICANSAGKLNEVRDEALASLRDARLPDKSCEGFEKTSIDEMFAPDYGVNISRVNIPVDIASSFKCDVPSLSTLLGFVVNDAFLPTSLLESKLPEGMFFGSLRRAAGIMPEIIGKYYAKIAPMGEASVALNSLLAQDGVLIYVPRGVKVERPLQLVNIFSSPVPLAAFRRVLIVIEPEASLQLLVCDHTQDSVNSYLNSQIAEVFVGEGARFEACSIEESSAKTSRYSRMFVRQESHSEFTFNSTTLTCGTTRNDFEIELHGEHSDTHLAGMAIGSDEMHIDNNSDIRHLRPRCHSNQLFKYVLDDTANGAFEGSILVAPGAQFTEAYQSNRNILASTRAKMHCKPQLEIYNDDVKCSHGATTGQLDNDALFYMRSRGIPENEAKTMLMQAFMVDVIDSVHISGLRERLLHLVDRRFSGSLGDCASCHAKEL